MLRLYVTWCTRWNVAQIHLMSPILDLLITAVQVHCNISAQCFRCNWTVSGQQWCISWTVSPTVKTQCLIWCQCWWQSSVSPPQPQWKVKSLQDVKNCTTQNFLQRNKGKPEVILFSHLNSIREISAVSPATSKTLMKCLTLSVFMFDEAISTVVKASFFQLCSIFKIKFCFSPSKTLT